MRDVVFKFPTFRDGADLKAMTRSMSSTFPAFSETWLSHQARSVIDAE